MLAFGAYICQAQLGAKKDAHGCLPSAGYQWCDALAKCVRPFESPCPSSINGRTTTRRLRKVTSPALGHSNGQGKNPHSQKDHVSEKCHQQCTKVCEIVNGDGAVLGNEDVCDHCHKSCASSTNSTHIPRNCAIWYDGCNKCRVKAGQLAGCTKMMCAEKDKQAAKCVQYNGKANGDKPTKGPNSWPTRKPHIKTTHAKHGHVTKNAGSALKTTFKKGFPSILDGKMWG